MTAPAELPAQPVAAGVLITFDSVYQTLLDVQRTVNRLSDTLGDVPVKLQSTDGRVHALETAAAPLADLPARVSNLESARARMLGASSVIAAVFGTTGGAIVAHLLAR